MARQQRPRDRPRWQQTRGIGWERELSAGAAGAITYVSLCVTHFEAGLDAGATFSRSVWKTAAEQ